MRSGKRRKFKSDVLQEVGMKRLRVGSRSSGSGFHDSRGSFNLSGIKFPEQGNRIGMYSGFSVLPFISCLKAL